MLHCRFELILELDVAVRLDMAGRALALEFEQASEHYRVEVHLLRDESPSADSACCMPHPNRSNQVVRACAISHGWSVAIDSHAHQLQLRRLSGVCNFCLDAQLRFKDITRGAMLHTDESTGLFLRT